MLILSALIFSGCAPTTAQPSELPTATPEGPHINVVEQAGLTQTVNENPEWLTKLIQKLESEPVANPPAFIAQYEYKGQLVYYLPPQCCDVPSILYDANGNIICHPDGGITGMGDGRCVDFSDERKNERITWKDQRTYP